MSPELGKQHTLVIKIPGSFKSAQEIVLLFRSLIHYMCLHKICNVSLRGMTKGRQRLSDDKNCPDSVPWGVSNIPVLSLLTFKGSDCHEPSAIPITRGQCFPPPGFPVPLSCVGEGAHPCAWTSQLPGPQRSAFSLWRMR